MAKQESVVCPLLWITFLVAKPTGTWLFTFCHPKICIKNGKSPKEELHSWKTLHMLLLGRPVERPVELHNWGRGPCCRETKRTDPCPFEQALPNHKRHEKVMAMGISEAVPLHKMLLLRIHSSQNLTQYVLAVDISWSTTIKKPVLFCAFCKVTTPTPQIKKSTSLPTKKTQSLHPHPRAMAPVASPWALERKLSEGFSPVRKTSGLSVRWPISESLHKNGQSYTSYNY